MPVSNWGLVQQNRAILEYGRNQIIISQPLNQEAYDIINGVFTFNPGSSDYLVGAAPYQDTQTLVFLRQSVWLVNGVVGGNSTVGTISPAGLYTAPANIPAYTSEPIKAELASNTKISGTQSIALLVAGPQITAVSPSPIPTGTVDITITGSGFLSGATVMVGGVQLSTGTITPTTIATQVYNPPGTTTNTFMVRNPLSAYSNSYTVQVGAAPVISPAAVSVSLGATQQFTATGATSWTAQAGTITAAGL
jgi:hypothetical protein